MKNRRIVVVAILLVAVLCLGVGYAALNDTITATGTINYGTQNLELQWTGNVTGDNATTETTGGDTLAFTVDTTNWEKDVEHTYEVTVTNTSTKYDATGVTVSAVTVTNNASANYTVEAEISAGTINANGTATVTITITLDEYPITEDYVQTFTFTVSNTGVTAA